MTVQPAPLADLLHGLNRNYPHVFTSRGDSDFRLNAVLFFAQGHRLAWCGQPLFVDPIVRTADGIHIDLPPFDAANLPPEGHFGFLGDAAHRYGQMTVTDLRTVLQATYPWQYTSNGQPFDLDLLKAWFQRPAETDDPDDPRPNSEEMAAANIWWAEHRASR